MKEIIERHYTHTPMTDQEKEKAEKVIVKSHKSVNYADMYNHLQNKGIRVSLSFVHEVYRKNKLPTKKSVYQNLEKKKLIQMLWKENHNATNIKKILLEKYGIGASLNIIRRERAESLEDSDFHRI